jgi:abortive infection bacteriophage resistance protein
MKAPYSKPALSFSDQINHLIANGMIVANRAFAEHCLQHISYYRLSAYWLLFENPKGQAGPRFMPGTKFEEVVDLYEFDRRFRLLVLDAIERIEVAVRGSWAYQLAMLAGGHGYVEVNHYADTNKFYANYSRLAADAGRSKDTFMLHYKAKYAGPPMPPVWMASELLSFGQLSQWYAALGDARLRQDIADPFGLDESIFVSLIHQLVVVRNICAHHGRLWNRSLGVTFKLPKKQPIDLANALNRLAPKQIYNTLAMLQFLLAKAEPGSDWAHRLKTLMASPQGRREADMGFPLGWTQLSLW